MELRNLLLLIFLMENFEEEPPSVKLKNIIEIK